MEGKSQGKEREGKVRKVIKEHEEEEVNGREGELKGRQGKGRGGKMKGRGLEMVMSVSKD